MPKNVFTLNDFSGGINNVKDSRDIANNELARSTNFMFDKQGAIRTAGSFTEYPDSGATSNLSGDTSDNQAGNGLFYIESDHSPNKISDDLSTSVTIGSATLYGGATVSSSSNPPRFYFYDSGVYGKFSVGDKFIIEGTSDNDGVYSIIRKYSTTDTYGNTEYKFSIDSEVTSEAFLTSGGTITFSSYSQYGEKIWIKPLDSDGSVADDLELSVWNSHASDWSHSYDIRPIEDNSSIQGGFYPEYYFIDEALRVSDSNFRNGSKVKWFGFIDRVHFDDRPFLGWYVKDNDLKAPTKGRLASTAPGDAGEGIYWNITTPTPTSSEGDSTWIDDEYETAMTFIYDNVQESKIFELESTYNTFTVEEGEAVKIEARMKGPYNPRTSGSRLYHRKTSSDDSWTLLADLDFVKGIRTSLNGPYKKEDTTVSPELAFEKYTDYVYRSDLILSLSQNLDTYESINGYSTDVESISLSEKDQGWKMAIVANRRTFIANVKIDSGTHYGDRIMYSEPGRFDTFPSYNYIDVVKGDSEEYVALAEYGDRLLAFKHHTLLIINIANVSPTAWFLEKTFKQKGVKHKEAVFRTEDGVIWVNDAGCWHFDGSNIINLIDNKLDPIQTYSGSAEHDLSWKDFYTDNSIVGYSAKYKQALVLQDCSGDTNNYVYCYDFRTRSWALLQGSNFFSTGNYSNFVLDGDGELAIMTSGGVIRYYNPISASNDTELVTKFMDFGAPNNLKKIYKISVTYKSSNAQADPMFYRYIDENGSMQSFAQLDGTVDFSTKSDWAIVAFKSTPSIKCQSIQFKLDTPSSGTIGINEIMIEHRIINKTLG